ncbi:LmeA family phospholipid-binding protein [Streptomyces odontomachi]|uniref:LmeA family phospholipid-binding protein n=1 Tax=Streptomyces odontomachi TaxID=2944940 RepID=UPI00210A00B7|nr:DUF2993 domain-containing protein [Streptomyces sp. ODS25]
MRALRITLIVVVVLAGIFVAADRIAVSFAQDKAADELRSSENLPEKPDVSINGFPFLTQIAGGELDDVRVGIDDYTASTEGAGGDGAAAKGSTTIHITDLNAQMKGVTFSNSFSTATADSATGSARISYAELLKAAQVQSVEVAPGVTAKVTRLSDGGNGKIKVTVAGTVLGKQLKEPITVLSTLRVEGDVVKAHADAAPKIGGVPTPESKVRQITDFQQTITGLPAGIHIDQVSAAPDGVHVTVAGSHVHLAG